MTNLEKQTDEILVLQSIFDTKFRFLHDNNQYEILIDFDLIEPFVIRYNNERCIINHLPSFNLIIHYHDEYPSDSPASFMLSCFYFSKSSLQNLCQKLDNYPFIKDEVCVYDWIESIKQEITNELILQTEVDEQINDSRALNGYLNENIDQIYRDLINYNNEQNKKQFRNQLQTCLICTDIILGIDCIRLHRCGHFYCRSCLNNYVKMALHNGRFGEKLHCPQNQCQKALLSNEIKEIIQDVHLYQRYERLTLQHALELMKDVIWCPRCQSAVLIGSGGDDNLAVCDQCHYKFCKKCKEKFHFQAICPEDSLVEQLRLQQRKTRERSAKQQKEERERTQKEKDEKRIVKQREKAVAESTRIEKQKKYLAEKNLAKQRYREIVIDLSEEDTLLEEILNAERMEVINTQPCPNCHVKIEKNGGCTHIHCSRCDYHFTWSAPEGPQLPEMTSLLYHSSDAMRVESIKTELNKKSDTAKVSEQNIEKIDSDPLKEDENEQDSAILINNRSLIGSAIVKRVKQCPNNSCNKLNVKMGEDNWIVCNECLEQYCFSCLKPINGPQHFEKKCDRYTSL